MFRPGPPGGRVASADGCRKWLEQGWSPSGIAGAVAASRRRKAVCGVFAARWRFLWTEALFESNRGL